MRVLIVEDERTVAELVRRQLKERHPTFAVDIAGSLAEARAAASMNRPHLIVLDVGLPNGEGLASIAEAAKIGVPIVIYTGRVDLDLTPAQRGEWRVVDVCEKGHMLGGGCDLIGIIGRRLTPKKVVEVLGREGSGG